jgi:hypothetical protein
VPLLFLVDNKIVLISKTFTQIIARKRHSRHKFLVTKFEFGGIFGMSLERDCHEVEVTPYFEFLVAFGMSLEEVYHELFT